jgi:hypothetical protein
VTASDSVMKRKSGAMAKSLRAVLIGMRPKLPQTEPENYFL